MVSGWTSQYFGALYGEIYERFLLKPSQSRQQAEFAARVLGLRSKIVLDLAAGFGRHAQRLAVRNRVWALDSNAEYLSRAVRGIRGTGKHRLHAVRGDMRELPFRDKSFGAAVCLFNSFGYFGTADSEGEGDLTVLREVARVLEPGGGFLLELPNPGPLLAAIRQAPRRHLITSEYEIEEEFAFDRERRVVSNRTLFRLGRRCEQAEYRLRVYSRAEAARMLRRAGFRIEALYGSYEGGAWQARESELLLVHASAG